MPSSRLARRSRLRSQALREPYARSRQALLGVEANSSVVTKPDVAQALLEGRLCQALEILHSRYKVMAFAPLSPEPTFEIQNLDAGARSLDLVIKPSDAGTSLAEGIFAKREDPGYDTVRHAGLRVRANGENLEVYTPGQQGLVTIHGVAADEILSRHLEYHDDSLCISCSYPNEIPEFEQDCMKGDRPEDLHGFSELLRRIGLLVRNDVISIDVWGSVNTRRNTVIAVEAWYPMLTSREVLRIKEEFKSSEFSPRWSLKGASPSDFKFEKTDEVRLVYSSHANPTVDIQVRLRVSERPTA